MIKKTPLLVVLAALLHGIPAGAADSAPATATPAALKTGPCFGEPDNTKTLVEIDAEDRPHRESYNRDDYRKLLTELSNPRYEVLPLRDFDQHADSTTDKVVVALRHDIDSHPLRALRMAELEKELGIRSTFFILHSANYYGTVKDGVMIRNGAVDKLAKQLNDMGFEIGIHRDLFNMMWKHQFEPRAFMNEEVAYYKTLGIPVVGSAAHGDQTTISRKLNEKWIYSDFGKTGAYVLEGKAYPYGEFPRKDFGVAYDAYLLKTNAYISDIQRKSPEEMASTLAKLPPGSRVQILIHPEHWQ